MFELSRGESHPAHASESERSVRSVLELLRRSAQRGYIGEPVSQLEHSLQCAYFATQSRSPSEQVIAALCHDIGHLCAPDDAPRMADYGVLWHERIGAAFLTSHGFSPTVAALVEGHVQAKRYNVSKFAHYRDRLSDASRQTLLFQGGAMDEAEQAAFERDPLFQAKLRLRAWDEEAKKTDFPVPGLESYIDLLYRHVQHFATKESS